jgi:hypothetical protein
MTFLTRLMLLGVFSLIAYVATASGFLAALAGMNQ